MVVLIIAILVLCLALIAQNIPYTVLWWAKEHSRELRKSRAQRSILLQRISEQKEEIRILQKMNNTLRRSLKHKAHMTPKHVATARRIIEKPWYIAAGDRIKNNISGQTDCIHIRNNGTCRIFNTPCVPCNLQKTEYESRMHTQCKRFEDYKK